MKRPNQALHPTAFTPGILPVMIPAEQEPAAGELGRWMHRIFPSLGRLRIIIGCIGAAVLYGLIHDQITIRICPEYFTVFHPFLIATSSLTLLALAWGIVATWWMGVIIGIIVSGAAQIGSWPKLTWTQILPYVRVFLLALGGIAVFSGIFGYLGTRCDLFSPPEFVSDYLLFQDYPRFMAAWYMHLASYFAGGAGALILAGFILQKRRKASNQAAQLSDHSADAADANS